MATIRLLRFSSLPDRYTRPKTWHPDRLIAFFFAPQHRFWAMPLHCSEVGCIPLLVEAGCSERPFALLHRLARFRTYRGRVNAPGLFLRNQPDFVPTRSVLNSAPRRPFPAFGEHRRPAPVVELAPGTIQPLPAATPSWGLHPSRSKRSADVGCLGLPSRSARFPSLPESQPVY